MCTPDSKRIRLSQGVENIANEVQTNVLLKVPIGICCKKFDEMRKNGQLCDIKIIAKDGKEIWGHKVVLAANSEYFNTMFNSQFKESKELEIKIQELDPYILSSLIDFIYSSVLFVNDQNVQETLNGICLLQLDDTIRNKCVDYIKIRIDPANCIGMKEMAECLGLSDFYSFCLSYTLNNFSQVYENEEILQITFDQILQIIKSEDICANEENVYKAVIKWIKYDRDNRYKHLSNLMEYVRLPIVSQEFFQFTVDKEPLLKLNNDCRKYLDEAYAVHTVLGTELEVPNSLRTQYRSKYSEYVLLISKCGKQHLPLLYNVVTNQWKTIPTIIPLRTHGTTYLLNDGRLLDIGGFYLNEFESDRHENEHNYNDNFYDLPQVSSGHIFNVDTKSWKPIKQTLKSRSRTNIVQIGSRIYVADSFNSEYYNIERDKWFKMNSLNIHRTGFAIIDLNGFIYAVGGNLHNFESNSVEQFDPQTDSWKSVAPMLYSRDTPTLAVLNGYMYAIGGKKYPNKYLSVVEKYDPSTDFWEEVAELNHNRSNAGAVAVNGLIYVFGGFHSNFTIEVYCPFKNFWTVLLVKVPNTLDLHGVCNAFNVKREIQNIVLKLIA